jgi:hypothetical protein
MVVTCCQEYCVDNEIHLLLFISTLVLFTHWLFLLIVLLLSRENDSTVAILKTVFIYSINKERRTKANIQIRMFKLDYLSNTNSNHDRIVVRCRGWSNSE